MKLLISFLLIIFFVFADSAISQTVYVTKSGRKYHNYDCRYINNGSVALSLEDAVSHGYTACKVCRPVSPDFTVPPVKKTESYNNNYYDSSPESYREKVQCSALTKSGNRCKRMTSNSSGKCWQHEGK